MVIDKILVLMMIIKMGYKAIIDGDPLLATRDN
jgi:hypothetical protein